MDELTQLKDRVMQLEKQLNALSKSSYYDFQKDIKILDGRKVICGGVKGTQIGGNIGFTGSKFGVFGVSPIVQRGGGGATAGASYGNTEKAMLQNCYDTLRAFGFLN